MNFALHTNFFYKNYFIENNILFINVNDIYYQFKESQIAYIYKSKTTFYIVDSNKMKVPISINCISDFPLYLNQKDFFRISKNVIINKNFIKIKEGLKKYKIIASNNTYKNKFKVKKHIAFILKNQLLIK